MIDYIDFEVYEILHLADWKEETIIKIRVFGFIDDKTFNVDFDCVCHNTLNTYNEVSDYLQSFVEYCYIKVENTSIEELIKANWLMNMGGV